MRYEIDKHRIEIVFVADQARFRKFLNAVVEYKGQFFIPRLVSVKNEKPQAPARAAAAVDPNAPAPAPAAGVGAPGAPSAPPAPAAAGAVAVAPAAYIVGEERVEVTLVLELVDFRESTPK